MRKNYSLFLALALCLSFTSILAQDTHFISDSSYRNQVIKDYQNISESINPAFFKQIQNGEKGLSKTEIGAYQFLYAYMPLSDLADYEPAFYAGIVKASTQIKESMPWVKNIPEDVYRHFVLPYRVNNARLDTSRIFFFHQLEDRVKNLDMLNAALEVNHWCHEHVTYQSADERTSGPIATYFNGYGRCGEESTFTVAALRSVGIPARQVYTPRWAHTDDNHAWVEFWANGKWYFYGACEPAPVANMGWFTEPARRAMLVNTRVIGKYQGSERTLIDRGTFSILNTLNVYAETKVIYAQITDRNGKPLQDAKVDFQLYNYGEYYSIAPKKTDKNGIASFETGLGDILVWAHTSDYFNWANVDVRETDTVKLQLNKNANKTYTIDIDYNPPIQPEAIVVSAEGKAANDKRFAYEDMMRAEHEKTFMDSIQCQSMATKNELNFKELWPIMQESRANWKEIERFVNEAPVERKQQALDMLKVIAKKDLHDTKAEVLNDHLVNTSLFEKSGVDNEEVYNKYLLNPRIAYEFLTPWRGFIKENIPSKDYQAWVRNEISIDNQLNFYRVPVSVQGIYKTKKSDEFSRNLLLVALMRTNGRPARLEPGTLRPQFYSNGNWSTLNAGIDMSVRKMALPGYLKLINVNSLPKLQYYKHFTIAQYNNGQYRTLEYEWDKNINDFPSTLSLQNGSYRITTGNRLTDGSVLVNFSFFSLSPNDTTEVEVKLRKRESEIKVLGIMPEAKLLKDTEKKKACSTEPNYQIYVYFQANNEPSKHAIQDLGAVKTQLEAKSIQLKLISESKLNIKKLDQNYFGNLPNTVHFSYDPKLKYLKEIENALDKNMGSEFPYIIVVNPNNEIIYLKEGYTIGVGEEILKLID